MAFRVLYLGPADQLDLVRDRLPASWMIEMALTPEAVDDLLPSINVVLDAYMRVPFPRERLVRAEALRLFVTATTGSDHIDATHLESRGIPLLTLLGQREVLKNITAAAEHSWLLLMACARQLIPAARSVVEGDWDRNRFPGLMLRGRTLGVIGCGRIGEWMSRYARGFGMRCMGYDPYLAEFPDTIEPVELRTLLEAADFVSIHVPLNNETKGLLGPHELQLLRPGAVIVNTSRGGIVDEGAILDLLRNERLGAVGLDVLASEPDTAADPLIEYARTHDNLLITPHIGGFSPDAVSYVLMFCCGRIRRELAVGDE